MLRLRLLLLPLVELEKKTRSMSLTMDELHTLRDKPDLEEDIVKLEAASKCVCVWGGGAVHTLRDKPDLEEDIVKLEAASRWEEGGREGGGAYPLSVFMQLSISLPPACVWFEDEEGFQARCASPPLTCGYITVTPPCFHPGAGLRTRRTFRRVVPMRPPRPRPSSRGPARRRRGAAAPAGRGGVVSEGAPAGPRWRRWAGAATRGAGVGRRGRRRARMALHRSA